ncbi:glycan-binding surface protein [Candidatus Kuenenia sp.]|uniref:carboxypeptidase regulatory-like domain-containing protein n=1 Tax=Candidatus Kuenenia sp. TaxID=2499824 RepID=UPI0032202C2A
MIAIKKTTHMFNKPPNHIFFLFILFLILQQCSVCINHTDCYAETDSRNNEKGLDTYVQLTVDISRDRQQISDYIYGVNVANWCQGYYFDLCAPKLKEANVSVVRLGATNMERYNYSLNRMYNVFSFENQYLSMSWESFVKWCRDDVDAEPFLLVPVFGYVAGDGNTIDDEDFYRIQTTDDVKSWIFQAGDDIKFWEIGNEPWIAWRRYDYPDIYEDSAHGDLVLNSDTAFDNYFPRLLSVADAIKEANPNASTFGPTPANWWLYWNNDYSLYCPVTEINGVSQPDDEGWQIMMDEENEWNREVFPDRGNDPEIVGWETDENRVLCQYLIRAAEHEAETGMRTIDFLDVHRYIQALTEYDAVQETRSLWQEGFYTQDAEIVSSFDIEPKILKRFQNMIANYYPGTEISFSEYDYFYWSGYPENPQIAAIGQMDYLGSFAKMGVKLACNWYVGEPNQAGSSYGREADSAKQAMFSEKGEPNPKYWAFRLMSTYFRGDVAYAESSDWEAFSVHACAQSDGDVVVVAAYKGEYDESGDLVHDQSAKTARLQISGFSGTLYLKQILRFGMNDPYIVEMETGGVAVSGGALTYEFQPLAIYAFIFSEKDTQTEPATYLHVNPVQMNFGHYETGILESDGETAYTMPVYITNARQGVTTWSVSENASWLDIAGETSGEAKVTDVVYVTIDRSDLSEGVYETAIEVNTPEGIVEIPVTVEVVSREAEGVRRICDFETGSLAHAWNESEPYSIGWWDAHGIPEDRNSPYIYRFSLDYEEKPSMGGIASMKIEFDRSNGDTKDGRKYMSFGTYGHKTVIYGEDGQPSETYDATANWEGYKNLQFDIKIETTDNATTELLVVITDEQGNKGKPDVGIKKYNKFPKLEDGDWQTFSIPLDGKFYDWRYPEGQDGSTTQLDFSRISMIEFIPWNGSADASGVIYLDNILLTSNAENKGKLSGTVVNKKNNKPVKSAKITLNGITTNIKWKTSSDDNGFFEIEGLDSGTYKIKTEKRGYKKVKTKIEIQGETEVTIEMKRAN